MAYIRTEVYKAKRRSKALKIMEDKMITAVDAMIDHITNNLEDYEVKDVWSTCVRTENAIMAMQKMIENGNGVHDPEGLNQILEDLRDFRRAIEVNM